MPSLALLLLNNYSVGRVVIITSHKGLMTRDRENYADYFTLAKFTDRVEYAHSLNVSLKRFDVLLIDEADHFMYGNPVAFERIIRAYPTICFTATIPESDLNQLEGEVLDRMGLKCYNYAPSVVQMPKRLSLDRIVDVQTDEKLLEFLRSITQTQPALVYTSKTRAAMILEKITDAFKVTVDTRADLLVAEEEMGHSGNFKVFVADDQLVCRGSDFRQKNVGFALLVDQGVPSERDAQ